MSNVESVKNLLLYSVMDILNQRNQNYKLINTKLPKSYQNALRMIIDIIHNRKKTNRLTVIVDIERIRLWSIKNSYTIGEHITTFRNQTLEI